MGGDWGSSSSPALDKGTLYLQIDNEEESFVVAIEAESGNELWRVQRPTASSWSTPIVWKNSLRTELVTNANDIRSYDPATGKLLWSLDYPGGRASSSPTGVGDILIVGNERRKDGGGILYAIKPGATGNITPSAARSFEEYVLWSTDEASAEFTSPLIHQGNVFLFGRNRGFAGAFDVATGKRIEGVERLTGARSFWSSSWANGNNIYCIDERGTVFVVNGTEQFKFIDSFPMGEIVRASPAIVDGTLLIRTEDHLYCITN